MQHQEEEEVYFCPSFSSYSSNKVAEIAAKISDEIKAAEPPQKEEKKDEEDFEFSLVCENPDNSIGEYFPVFNQDLLLNEDELSKSVNSSIQVSLRDLFLEEREEREVQSSSSSEVDELESVAPGTYCVWRPKTEALLPDRCKKSNSTGSAFKRWNIRDLMRRSNSDGRSKDSFVFLESSKVGAKLKAKENTKAGEKASSSMAAIYHKNNNKRKSYLPYRQDLVGLFANVNGFGRTFPPF